MATSSGTVQARFVLDQAGTMVTGTWAITSANNTGHGLVNGILHDGALDASISWDSPQCGVSGASATGTTGDRTLTISSPVGFTSDFCALPKNVTWSLAR